MRNMRLQQRPLVPTAEAGAVAAAGERAKEVKSGSAAGGASNDEKAGAAEGAAA
jgi:hypothetical protein